jgi:hypothetical protein
MFEIVSMVHWCMPANTTRAFDLNMQDAPVRIGLDHEVEFAFFFFASAASRNLWQ